MKRDHEEMSETSSAKQTVSLLDYGAGNVRSLRNAIKVLGFEVVDIVTPEDIDNAKMIIFPGVGSFGQAIKSLNNKGWMIPLRKYIQSNRPFFGICIGMQSLFEGSDESSKEEGLGIIPGRVARFSSNNPNDITSPVRIPQIGWNGCSVVKKSCVTDFLKDSLSSEVYFVHSYRAMPTAENLLWVLGVTDYGGQKYISVVQKGNVLATQFHPEKSGNVGLKILKNFLELSGQIENKNLLQNHDPILSSLESLNAFPNTQIVKRIVACLDVRSNDDGDLVVTKGDQYDVREVTATTDSGTNTNVSGSSGSVRNLGKPVELCRRYYQEGADEIVFLNITSFRQGVIEDLPMLKVLEQSSECVFVPLTVGGGIREYVDETGKEWSALDVVTQYFRAGADKVSIGSDAVFSVEEYLKNNRTKNGKSSIEVISQHYGAQAVVVSIDPKRVYLHSLADAVENTTTAPHKKVIVKLSEKDQKGPDGQEYCWWQVTVKGGRESRDLCAVTLAQCCEELGAGEIMLNSIDMDGQGKGYDLPLIAAVQSHVSVPVIASSGVGKVEHFSQVFQETNVLAALAAGVFHRHEIEIKDVKTHLMSEKIPARLT